MTATRKKFKAKFKAMVAKEAMKEQLTLAELSKKYEVIGKQISVWKREAESRMEELFGTPKEKTSDGSDELQRLRAKLGELTMERDFFEEACKRVGLK